MLFKKYLPQSLDQIYGQDKTIFDLKKRIEKNVIPNIIYLNGKSGLGKTSLAKIIAKYVLCENKINKNPCNCCSICKAVNLDQFTLNYNIYNGSNVNIDVAREIQENAEATYAFSTSEKKVIIIDELQEAISKSKAAVLNLLKFMDKDLPNVYFILTTMDDSKIPIATTSRTVIYNFHDIPMEKILTKLDIICTEENFKLENKNLLKIIAENSSGNFRQAESYLERLIYSEFKTEEELRQELRLISNDDLNTILNKILAGEYKTIEFNKLSEESLRLMQYQLNKRIKNLTDIPLVALNFLETFIELWRYPYLTPTLIESILLNLTIKNSKIISKNFTAPVPAVGVSTSVRVTR